MHPPELVEVFDACRGRFILQGRLVVKSILFQLPDEAVCVLGIFLHETAVPEGPL